MHLAQRFAPIAAAAILLAASTRAQVALGGALSDATTGPLQSGVVYYVASGISLASGQTLTVQPGAMIKFGTGATFDVSGTLLVNGNAGQKVHFTSMRDDSVGGDTNGDGASSGTPGDWTYMRFYAGSGASALHHAVIRFGGRGGWTPLRFETGSQLMSNCSVEQASGHAVQLVGAQSTAAISNTNFIGNVGWAIVAPQVDALVNLSNNSASGNGGNGVLVTSSALSVDTTLSPAQTINGVVTLGGGLAIPAGRTFTVGAGVILKLATSTTMEMTGTLITQGSGAQPVVITSFSDDTVGGDTNNDGPSTGAATRWTYMRFHSGSSASNLAHTTVRFGGAGGWTPLRFENSSPILADCKIEQAAGNGVEIASSQSTPTITNSEFIGNAGWAISAPGFETLVNLANNTATGNGFNAVLVAQGALGVDTVVKPESGLSGTFVVASSVTIPAGRTLTFDAGVIAKFLTTGTCNISGTFVTNGTTTQPVVITSFTDDAYGGDTNNNGASVGSPGQWIYIRFDSTSSASRVKGAIVRYGGGGGWNPFYVQDASPTIESSIIEHAPGAAISLANSSARPLINRCLIRNNGGVAIGGAQVGAVPFITRNIAINNGANQISVSSGTLTEDLTIDGNAGINGSVVMATALTVPAGRKLTLGPGAVLKFQSGGSMSIHGALDVIATSTRPAVLTADRDDSIGGDSNGNATPPAPGHWLGLEVSAGAAASDIEHLELRYGGLGGFSAWRQQSPLAQIRHCRVERSGAAGFELNDGARADFLSAWSCATTGIHIAGGAFDLRHATVASCGTGIHRQGTLWSGTVRDSIAFFNTTDFSGLPSSQVVYSDGFTGGGLGNIIANPHFVDLANGNLHLGAGSPCIGAGDPFSPVDGDCSATDMGAFPASSSPSVYCNGKSNSAGCTPFMAWSGLASVSSAEPFRVRAFNVLNNKNGLFFYGFGRDNAPFQGGTKCVSNPVHRLPIQGSGGHAFVDDCSGMFELDFNALIQSGGDPMLVSGSVVNVQCWYRDPAVPSDTGLSDGLEFSICN